MTFDCSKKEDNNPTRILQDSYQELMGVSDLDILKQMTLDIVVTSSISKENLAKFRKSHDKIKTLAKYQGFVTNFILAGSGLGIK